MILAALVLAGLLAAPAVPAMDQEPSGFGAARWGEPVAGYRWLVATGCYLGPVLPAGVEAKENTFFPSLPVQNLRCYRLRRGRQQIAGVPLEKLVYLAWQGRFFAVRGAFVFGADLQPIRQAFLARFGRPDTPQSDPTGLLKKNPKALIWSGRSVWMGLRNNPAGYPEFFMFFSPILKLMNNR